MTLDEAIVVVAERNGRPHEFDWEVLEAAEVLVERVTQLESAVTATLREHAYLADGDQCTLWKLKAVMAS